MNNIFTDTLQGIRRERPPVWFMRQAGRILPEYMALREKYSFHQLMNIPERTAEVTLQPVHCLGVDAAILFSDILVVPEAMGMKLEFTDRGPRFENPLKEFQDPLKVLQPNPDKLLHIYQAIDIIQTTKPTGIPLIGFCGAPLTTLFYMIQGISANHLFPDAIEMLYRDPETADRLLATITNLSVEYALNQVQHGISAFQLFDTHAGLIPSRLYQDRILPHVQRIVQAVQATGTPVIFFPKGLGAGLIMLKNTTADFIGIDWQTSLEDAQSILSPGVGLQGNLDPRVLTTDIPTIRKALETYLSFGCKNHRWIFNLGHGVLPQTPLKNVQYVVDWVKNTDWKRG